MNSLILNTVVLVIGVGAGVGIALSFLRGKDLINVEKKQKKGEEYIEKSKKEGTVLIEETKKRVSKRREHLKTELETREERTKKKQENLRERENNIEKREKRMKGKKSDIVYVEKGINETRETAKRIEKEILEKLSKKTEKSTEMLKTQILEKYEKELNEDKVEKLTNIEENLKENATKTANRILISSLQRMCSSSSVETRAVLVKVPKDHVKGKIVGKGGRNIREIEKLLEVDIVFNDLPNTISISAYNLVKRRIGQKAVEKLVRTRGEINERVIARAVKDAERETDEELYAIGKKAVDKMGIDGKNKELTRIIGRLKYRTSYGQNIMKHSMEVAWMATMLGSEIGLDVEVCKVGGFLHDLGKAIDQDPNIEGGHDFLSKELMEKYGFTAEEVHAAWTHHDAIPQETPEALIVKAADAISASRPGARQESIDRYVERLQALEEAANSFEGVKSTYAISAGRELRIMVDPEKVEDKNMEGLAEDIAEKIEENISYPGTIKVKVIRRTQYTEVSR